MTYQLNHHNNCDTFYVDNLTIKRILLVLFMALYSERSMELISGVSLSQNEWPCCSTFNKQMKSVYLRNS